MKSCRRGGVGDCGGRIVVSIDVSSAGCLVVEMIAVMMIAAAVVIVAVMVVVVMVVVVDVVVVVVVGVEVAIVMGICRWWL